MRDVLAEAVRGYAYEGEVMTPYPRGRKLPRYEDGEGLDRVLGSRDEIHITGLPVGHDLQGAKPYRTTRQALRDGKGPVPEEDTLPGGFTFAAKPHTDGLSCYVAAGFDDGGALVDLQHGPGSCSRHGSWRSGGPYVAFRYAHEKLPDV